MAKPKSFSCELSEIAELLVIKENLTEGHWGMSFGFGIGAGMIPYPPGDDQKVVPAAIVPVIQIGIQRFDQPNSLTVDAAEVNPATLGKTSKKKKAATKKRASKKSS